MRELRASIATLKANPTRCPIDPDSDVYGEEVRVLLHGKRRGVHRVLFAASLDGRVWLRERLAARRMTAVHSAKAV